jgi:Tfp pilus assembly protein PilV
MDMLVRDRRFSEGLAGFSLAELLGAVVIISLGLVAVAAGFATAIQGVETSDQQATATLLAEQRLEQIRATVVASSPVGCKGFANITAACFPAQGYAGVANAPGYRSTVTITDYIFNGNIAHKRVDVEVFYRPIVARGALGTERSVRLSTLITNET